jgi:nitrogen regulatory protein P-II 1
MFEIHAIIRPQKLAAVREALRAIPNFPGLTISKADGFTAPAGVVKRSVREELTDYTPKMLLTVLADQSMVGTIRDCIINNCSTKQIGDGIVWVTPILEMHRIRNGESMM